MPDAWPVPGLDHRDPGLVAIVRHGDEKDRLSDHDGMQLEAGRVWRVRGWIRALAVLAVLALAAEQVDVIHRVRRGEMPGAEMRDGFIGLAVLVLLVWRIVFYPRAAVCNGWVEIRNPLRQHRFATSDVEGFEMTSYGLRCLLVGGRRQLCFIFQDTARIEDPRWFELAEAITGRRPTTTPRDEAHAD